MKQKTNLANRLNQLYGSMGYGASVQDTVAQIQTDLLALIKEDEPTNLDLNTLLNMDKDAYVETDDVIKMYINAERAQLRQAITEYCEALDVYGEL